MKTKIERVNEVLAKFDNGIEDIHLMNGGGSKKVFINMYDDVNDDNYVEFATIRHGKIVDDMAQVTQVTFCVKDYDVADEMEGYIIDLEKDYKIVTVDEDEDGIMVAWDLL